MNCEGLSCPFDWAYGVVRFAHFSMCQVMCICKKNVFQLMGMYVSSVSLLSSMVFSNNGSYHLAGSPPPPLHFNHFLPNPLFSGLCCSHCFLPVLCGKKKIFLFALIAFEVFKKLLNNISCLSIYVNK